MFDASRGAFTTRPTAPPFLRPLTVAALVFCRIARFSNVHHLSVHVTKNFGAECTKVFYIGLRGEYTEVSDPFKPLKPSRSSLTR